MTATGFASLLGSYRGNTAPGDLRALHAEVDAGRLDAALALLRARRHDRDGSLETLADAVVDRVCEDVWREARLVLAAALNGCGLRSSAARTLVVGRVGSGDGHRQVHVWPEADFADWDALALAREPVTLACGAVVQLRGFARARRGDFQIPASGLGICLGCGARRDEFPETAERHPLPLMDDGALTALRAAARDGTAAALHRRLRSSGARNANASAALYEKARVALREAALDHIGAALHAATDGQMRFVLAHGRAGELTARAGGLPLAARLSAQRWRTLAEPLLDRQLRAKGHLDRARVNFCHSAYEWLRQSVDADGH